jgi:predicted CoA-substrate-specific enzyme activase
MRFIGLDAGSVSVKVVVLDGDVIKKTYYLRHKGHPLKVAYELLKSAVSFQPSAISNQASGDLKSKFNSPIHPFTDSPIHRFTHSPDYSLSITGSAGRLIASVLGIEPVNELVTQSYSTKKLYPHIKSIIELGGEDSKLIILGESASGGSVKEFSMNSVCAAGTGSFLDQQAERLKLTIEEFSELSLKSKKPPRIAGRCSVFAKSDMIHLQQIATPLEDIVAGLCFAVARNFKGSISRGRKIDLPVSFQGGVAANKGMVRAFQSIFELDDLFVPPDFFFMGALGAVFKDMDEGKINTFDIEKLEDFIRVEKHSETGYKPLISKEDDFLERHALKVSTMHYAVGSKNETIKDKSAYCLPPTAYSQIGVYLGIDIGSISTNLAVIDETGRLLSKRYLMTAGQPIEAVKQGLREIGEEIGDKVEIIGVGTTGSGRYMIADYVGADIVKNEITAQATAAAFIDKNVDTIFEIGGQDSKYISLRDGIIVDFEMNKACAAGTGSFLEEQAEKLSISIKNEFADCAFSAGNPCKLGERCTVFMENSLMSNLQKGADKNDLLAGLAYSIVQNYINRVVAGKPIGKNIFFQGGVAFNKSVVAAFEKYLDTKITVPPNHDVTGAIGMALIARDYMKDKYKLRVMSYEFGEGETKNLELRTQNPELRTQNLELKTQDPKLINSHRFTHSPIHRVSSFKGFELSKRPYNISSFECRGCPNVCEINRVKIEGEDRFLFYGGRCEKYDVRRAQKSMLPDLFSFREEMLWKAHNKRAEERKNGRAEVQKCRSAEVQKERKRIFRASELPHSRTSALKIGIPYIFYFHDYLPFWSTFLWDLGFEVIVSPKTNKQVVNLGVENVASEACFPVKVAHGHIKYLKDAGVDAIFIPSFININQNGDEYQRGLACPYVQTIPYISNAAIKDMKVISPVVDFGQGARFFKKELNKAFRNYGVKEKDISRAVVFAQSAQEEFQRAIKEKGKEILKLSAEAQKCESTEERNSNSDTEKLPNFRTSKLPTIVIIGRAYNAFDSGVNLEIPKKLANLDVLSIPMDFLPIETISLKSEWTNMYWRSGQKILRAARIVRNTPNLYAIYIGNFSCGPDSFILKYFKEEMGGKPFLHIEIDEHSADTGAITRCEAFLDSIKQQSGRAEEQKSRSNFRASELPSFRSSALKKRVVFIPRMTDHTFALRAALIYSGIPAEILPESDKTSIDIASKYVTGKECYPYIVTAGSMLKRVFASDFKPDESAFFMPTAGGPCRFGQYNVSHKLILDKLGLKDIPVVAPEQDIKFFSDIGVNKNDFSAKAWIGIIAIELLTKCLHETRPYEKTSGDSEELYNNYLKLICDCLLSQNGQINSVLKTMKDSFASISRKKEDRPLIGIIGEIFVRLHKFSNENLIKKIESLGGEVWLAPFEEWIYYVDYLSFKRALIKKDRSAIINIFLKRFFQKRIEHRLTKTFKGFLKTLNEPETKEILKNAEPYVHDSFEGETILSVGKAIDLIEKGASGIINAMPFGCMPGTIVTALMKAVSRDYGVPCISIPYDGTESPTTEIQLEAFMHQAFEYSRQHTGNSRQRVKH